MDEITSVENFFKTVQVHLSRVWLNSCISWCKEMNLPPNYTLKELQLNVFQQWLLLDLRDLEVSCLPPNLSNQKKYILNDNYTLQLMQVVDISKPKYWQLQRIRNGVPKNLEQESESTKRVLQLTLTDGVQEIEAMEYKPISCLNLNLSPGIKIRLMAPIEVRRGRLMLEEDKVKVIGGEVDSLLVSNAAENILAKYLNLPLNPKPATIEESKLITAETQNCTTININANKNNSIGQNIAKNNTNHSKNETNNNNDMEQFDELKMDEDILMEIENEFEQNIPRNKNKSPDMFEDNDIDFEALDIPDVINKQEISEQELINISDEITLNKSVLPQPVLLTVDKLVKMIPNVTNGKFKIRAKFKSIIEKMSVIENEFRLILEVEDDSGTLILKVHSDVVAELMGHTATDFMKYREEISKNPEMHWKPLEALKSLQSRLIALDSVLEILVNVNENFPVLVKIL